MPQPARFNDEEMVQGDPRQIYSVLPEQEPVQPSALDLYQKFRDQLDIARTGVEEVGAQFSHLDDAGPLVRQASEAITRLGVLIAINAQMMSGGDNTRMY
jgi:hypothetical protein